MGQSPSSLEEQQSNNNNAYVDGIMRDDNNNTNGSNDTGGSSSNTNENGTEGSSSSPSPAAGRRSSETAAEGGGAASSGRRQHLRGLRFGSNYSLASSGGGSQSHSQSRLTDLSTNTAADPTTTTPTPAGTPSSNSGRRSWRSFRSSSSGSHNSQGKANEASEEESGDLDDEDEDERIAAILSPVNIPFGLGSEPPSLVDFVDFEEPSSEDNTVLQAGTSSGRDDTGGDTGDDFDDSNTSDHDNRDRNLERHTSRLLGLHGYENFGGESGRSIVIADDNPSTRMNNATTTPTSTTNRGDRACVETPSLAAVAAANLATPELTNNNNNNNNNIIRSSNSVEDDNEDMVYYVRRTSVGSVETGSTVSYMEDEEADAFNRSNNDKDADQDFYPQKSRDFEWMGRSIESLILGHAARAPMLHLVDEEEDDDYFAGGGGGEANIAEDFYAFRRRSTASTFGGCGRRRSSHGSFAGGRRGSLSLSGIIIGGTPGAGASGGGGGSSYHGGTLANYRRRQVPTDVDRSYNERQGRRGSTTHTPMYRRRGTGASAGSGASGTVHETSAMTHGGPNIVLTLMARENTGKSFFPRYGAGPVTQRLRSMGGHALFTALDKPAAGICTEVAFLEAAIDTGDWTETQTIISRLSPRIIGDPLAASHDRGAVNDPTLPPTAPRFYAGGGRTGLERDAFVQAGGVEVLIRVFREKSFVGQEMAYSYDARDLSPEIVAARLAPCWNEALASIRELVFSIPSLVEERRISDNGEFIPFLFTLLSHQSCFDNAAALIEEILALLSQSPQPQPLSADSGEEVPTAFMPAGRTSPPTTFFLGNVPDLYKLWGGFSCRQLAHFCRILALLVFEPEDRQILESPAVLKSLELLQLRRNRAVRAGCDSTVDMNQSILLGDGTLVKRLLMLLRVMNFAPALRRIAPYHVMAQYPFIADTLVMLGHGEIESWNEIDRQEALARKLLEENNTNSYSSPTSSTDEPELFLSELGGVADMLEGLSETLGEASTQIGHIIHVISAAQQAGVIVGRGGSRSGRRRGRGRGRGNNNERNNNRSSAAASATNATDNHSPSEEDRESAAAALRLGGIPVDNATIQSLASVAGILTDQVLVRRLYQSTGEEDGGLGDTLQGDEESVGGMNGGGSRYFINTPEDCANAMQFNAILLGSYQVEVLFVLCTLLGGRRKLDAQDMLEEFGLVSVLDDMFQRLPWFWKMSRESGGGGGGDDGGVDDRGSESQNGIHGPGCECTPESALCVQYLRLLHNFCARDCDNYSGRRLLLSDSERNFVFHGPSDAHHKLKPGLLSKIIGAFVNESDESPYRFWLASCIESYLRGSSTEEQMFAAQSGLMSHLIDDVSSDRLHCAGSLQTSFDLLGELGKGNSDVIRLLVNDLDEERFRKLMSVAAANLVDSNVFIRSLLLSLERLSAADLFIPLYVDADSVGITHPGWMSETGSAACSYLSHSWWDAKTIPLNSQGSDCSEEDAIDEDRQADWFPSLDLLEINSCHAPEINMLPSGLEESVGHFGWVFTPGGDSLSASTYLPNTVERLSWFLAANQARLLRDLLGVVDLRNINHENICCLNTAVVIAIFAHRRRQLSLLLNELRQMNDEEKETKRRPLDAAHHDDVVDRAFAQAMRYLDLENRRETPPYARIASIAASTSLTSNTSQQIGDRTDVMRNFREVLWFWTEYYTHRGRDRLSLEFSSHLRFQEWNHVVSLLAADDGSSTALVRNPARLPRSPYQRTARIAENPIRGV